MTACGNTRLTKILGDIQTYHTTAEQAGRIAQPGRRQVAGADASDAADPAFLAEPVFMTAVARERPSGSLLGHDRP
ncbi:MAG: hypothetical protein WDN04_07460 [Rhodospirillales bacterium]